MIANKLRYRLAEYKNVTVAINIWPYKSILHILLVLTLSTEVVAVFVEDSWEPEFEFEALGPSHAPLQTSFDHFNLSSIRAIHSVGNAAYPPSSNIIAYGRCISTRLYGVGGWSAYHRVRIRGAWPPIFRAETAHRVRHIW